MCKPVHHEVEISATPRQVYEAYLDSDRHARITGQSAKMSRKEGGRFSAGDSYISGFNVELVPSRRIVQAWRASEWPEGSYSILRLEFKSTGRGTRISVDHLGIPDEFRDGVDKGWYEFYWEPMKKYFSTKESSAGQRKKPRMR